MQNKQDNTPKLVSFIVPVYNVPRQMVHECINSIRALSLSASEREIIIVDDGSQPSVLADIDDILDQDILYIRQCNRGVAVARNNGIRMASGLFVQFVDADDMLITTPYEHVLDLVRYANVDMVCYDFCHEQPPSTAIDYKDSEPADGATVMRRNNIHGSAWGYVFKRSILGNLIFTPGLAYGEDEEFTPQLMLRAERLVTTTAQAYLYRQRPASAINRKDMRSHIRRINNAWQVIQSLKAKSSTMPAEQRVAMQRRVAQLSMDYIYTIITLTRSRHYLDRKLEQMGRAGLFPLPDRDYTQKYKWFRKMTNSSLGLTLLMRTLPYISKEK